MTPDQLQKINCSLIPFKTMFSNYLKIAFRNLMRNKTYSMITILGLALGMACCILLMLTVNYERQFDTFHEKKESLYRVFTRTQESEGEELRTNCPLPLAPTMKAELPGVEYVSRFSSSQPATVKYNNTPFREYPVFVDADFFSLFTLKFLQGSPNQAFQDLQSMVIAKEVADKIFGENANALGKQVSMQLGGQFKTFQITGVIDNLPQNSSMELTVLVRFENNPQYIFDKDRWDNISTDTYFSLKPTTTIQEFERTLQPFTDKHFAENIQSRKDAGVKANERGHLYELYGQPLWDWHFGTMIDKTNSAKTPFYSLMAIAVLIMLIAAINFINLSVARSITRSREVGIRKTVGAQKGQIVYQFLGEALLIVGIALVVSLVVAEAMLPLYNSLMRLKLSLLLSGGIVENLMFWGALLTVLLLVGVCAGSYPAFYLSRLQAVHTFKPQSQGFSASQMRNILVVVQFSLAVGLIACTMIVHEQTAFMQAKSLGFNRSGVVMIPTGDGANGNATMERFKSRLVGNPAIVNMSVGTKPIGRGLDNSDTRSHIARGYNGGEVSVDVLSVYFNYIETLEIPMLAGRTFDKAHLSVDTAESIIPNELAARQIWNLIPKEERLKRSQNGEFTPQAIVGFSVPSTEKNVPPMTVIGVTKDYHVESMRRKIAPTIHVMWSGSENYIFVRTGLDKLNENLALLERTWREVAPDVPWQGSIVDDNIARLYRNYTRMTNLTITAAVIAVALSCIGLFALAAMAITARTKEIGIRKVLGASIANIIGLLSRDFLKLVGLGIVIATPVAWWLMRSWLQGFAYRTELNVLVFVLAGIMAVGIAFLTVAGQAFRAARANPVNSLRSE